MNIYIYTYIHINQGVRCRMQCVGFHTYGDGDCLFYAMVDVAAEVRAPLSLYVYICEYICIHVNIYIRIYISEYIYIYMDIYI